MSYLSTKPSRSFCTLLDFRYGDFGLNNLEFLRLNSLGWRVCSDGEIPSDAFEAGKEDGNSLYVARAYHEGDLIPGKLNPKHGLCYISWGGLEYEKKEYWVLCGSNLVWEESSFGRSNPRAVVGGKTILGENLYIGLAKHSSDSIVGKVHPSHKRCYVAYNGRELYYQHYKILTSDRTQK